MKKFKGQFYKEPVLYISCGIPGSGKSTYLNKVFGPDEIIVSRDKVRFSLLKEGEAYFSHENEVFDTFIDDIIYWIKQGNNVYADATHLNRNSRNILIYALKAREPELNFRIETIFFDVPIDICLQRNELRKGTKAYVPKSVIRRMYNQMSKPTQNESHISHSWIIDKDGNVSKDF